MEPFLKWAGGKRWLTSKNADLLPDEFNHYYEPFIGSGAVFFFLQPENGVISDINADLINCYQTIKDNWKELVRELRGYHKRHSTEFYYQIREYKPITPLNKAARFIYLNRTCWNGLYRVNQKGEFNVPIGTKSSVILETDDFEQLSDFLQHISIEVSDFQTVINRAGDGDFIFVDPPYTVKHNLNGFIKYNEKLFSWDDQVRLKTVVEQAVNRGAKALVLNADHSSIRQLYRGVGEVSVLNRASVIAGNSNARGIYSELAIKCGW